ncbi:MAG: glycosyltransferase family 2 protein [Desulfuromonadales bacterium]|nr:glycosyltransferase family 2 protein [Desulfuromonadales bacterium]
MLHRAGQAEESRPFSVIIPTYNRAHCIMSAVNSVLNQTHADFELIVVNDGSTDNTVDLLAAIDDERMRVIHQENRGVSAARNAGLAAARGEWMTFLDSDDEAKAKWLEEIARCIRSIKKAGIVFCGHEVRYFDGNRVKSKIILPKPAGPLFDNAPVKVLAGTFALRKDLLSIAGGYAENLRYSENTELLLRVVTCCLEKRLAIGKIDLPLTIYNKQPFNVRAASPLYYRNTLDAVRYILDKHQDLFRKDPAEHFNYNAVAGVNAARLGLYAEARKLFACNVRIKPLSAKNYMRLFFASVPPLARLVWLKSEGFF